MVKKNNVLKGAFLVGLGTTTYGMFTHLKNGTLKIIQIRRTSHGARKRTKTPTTSCH
jgi:hypothetical protein